MHSPAVLRAAQVILVAMTLASGPLAARVTAQTTQSSRGYVIGNQDVVSVLVYNQPSLSGKFTVENDGTINYPLLGRLKAGGLTERQLETAVRTALIDGFLKNPQVSVAVEQYRSQQIFIVGDVRSPGSYPLTGEMSILEALARAGVGTSSPEAVIVRAPHANAAVLPGQDASAEVIRVPLKALESGELSHNVRLQDGDTIFVPKPEIVCYVFGQVRSPGSYPLQPRTTVLQVLALAGGATPASAMGRIKIIRVVNGKDKEIKVKLNDLVQPGDTIIVPERYF
jgi:polysaccharide export outer membrane protein